MITTIFKAFLTALESNDKNSSIWQKYLREMNEYYQENNSNVRIVLDYIAGMTDDYLALEYKKQIKR